ncbi:MAG TPA: tetratricopeptide repeat protein [Bryobacteraceae bacterium]|jgi:tetratricopeptide (TPR) repeat protein|nr:tetratricopeptide repeat protein [Bryobacteraceae bacterium]
MPLARCVLLTLLLAIEVSAAPHALRVRGQVSHGKIWTKVRLFARGPANAPLVTLSDRKGHFSFDSVPEGTYTLYVNVRGIGSASRTVEVRQPLADESGAIQVDLPSSDFNSLAELRRKDYTVSIQQLSDDPFLPPRAFSVAQQDLTNGQLDKARVLLEGIVAESPKYVAAWDELAYASVVSGNYVEAEAQYRKALDLMPTDFTALLGMARTLLERNRLEEALDYHRRAVAQRPRNAVAQARLGFNYFELGNFDEAETCLLSAEHIDPANYTRPQLILAEIYFREHDEAAAAGQLADYVKRFPGEEDAAIAVRTRVKASPQAGPAQVHNAETLSAGR